MNQRDRFISCITGQKPDSPPFWFFWGPWETTWEKLKNQGMPNEFESCEDVGIFFGADPLPSNHVVPVNLGPPPQREIVVLQEKDNEITFIDSWGVNRRDIKGNTSMSQFLEFAVHDGDIWKTFKEQWLNPDDERRADGEWRSNVKEWNEAGLPVPLSWYPDSGIFGPYRWLMGDEEGLIAFYTMPELVNDIMQHLTDIYTTVFEKVARDVKVDLFHFSEDMSYSNGFLISAKMWGAFIAPHYTRIKIFAEKIQIEVISVDTDGNPDAIMPNMLGCGVNLLYPMEVAAGCDVNKWQIKYPELGMMGGVDKRVLDYGHKEIYEELFRLIPAIKQGRHIPELDHLIPDNVSWDNYYHYAQSLKKLVGAD